MIAAPNRTHIAVKPAALGKWDVLHVSLSGRRTLARFSDHKKAAAHARVAAARDGLPLKLAAPDSQFRPHA